MDSNKIWYGKSMLNLPGECDFGSDWPIITPGIYIDNLSSIWLNIDQMKKIYIFKCEIVATNEIRAFYDYIYKLLN
jgi:hypothetical protein